METPSTSSERSQATRRYSNQCLRAIWLHTYFTNRANSERKGISLYPRGYFCRQAIDISRTTAQTHTHDEVDACPPLLSWSHEHGFDLTLMPPTTL